MASNSNFTRGEFPALASLTSANGAARNGASIQTGLYAPGTISVRCRATIVTGSVVATFRVQVSADDSTYIDLKPMNNPANVSLSATGEVVLAVDSAAHGWRFVRVVAVLSGAATAAGDLTEAGYRALDVRADRF